MGPKMHCSMEKNKIKRKKNTLSNCMHNLIKLIFMKNLFVQINVGTFVTEFTFDFCFGVSSKMLRCLFFFCSLLLKRINESALPSFVRWGNGELYTNRITSNLSIQFESQKSNSEIKTT